MKYLMYPLLTLAGGLVFHWVYEGHRSRVRTMARNEKVWTPPGSWAGDQA